MAVERTVLLKLVERGLTTREMAVETGVSQTNIRRWLSLYGLSTRRPTPPTVAPGARLPREVSRACEVHGSVRFVLEGRGYYRCKRCRQDRVAAWRRKTRRSLVDEAGGRCSLCGYDRCVGALVFHHLDPAAKAFGLSARGLTRPLAELRREARKCVLLCANCHAEVERSHGATLRGGRIDRRCCSVV